jgi:hypothetical protein
LRGEPASPKGRDRLRHAVRSKYWEFACTLGESGPPYDARPISLPALRAIANADKLVEPDVKVMPTVDCRVSMRRLQARILRRIFTGNLWRGRHEVSRQPNGSNKEKTRRGLSREQLGVQAFAWGPDRRTHSTEEAEFALYPSNSNPRSRFVARQIVGVQALACVVAEFVRIPIGRGWVAWGRLKEPPAEAPTNFATYLCTCVPS